MRGNKPLIGPPSLGADLTALRESRDLSLEQVEYQTKIRVHYLEALENDDYAALPSPMQGKGFLRNYARFLGMDAEEAVTRFNMGVIAQSRTQGRRRSTDSLPIHEPDRVPERTQRAVQNVTQNAVKDNTPLPRRSSTTPGNGSASTMLTPTAQIQVVKPARRTGLSDPAAERAEQRRRQTRAMTLRAFGALTVAAFILIALLIYSLHPDLLPAPIAALFGIQPTAAALIFPSATPATLMTSTPTIAPTALPVNNTANGTAIGTAANGSANSSANTLTIQITVHDRSPLQIKIDDQVRYSGVPVPNTVITYTVQGTQQLFLHTGNAASLDVALNGVMQPSLGLDHQIADKVYSVANVQSSAAGGAISTPVLTATPTSMVIPPTATIGVPTAGLKP